MGQPRGPAPCGSTPATAAPASAAATWRTRRSARRGRSASGCGTPTARRTRCPRAGRDAGALPGQRARRADRRGRRIGAASRGYDWLLGVGDLNGDRRPDLVARARPTGTLYLLPGPGRASARRRLRHRLRGLRPRRLSAGGQRAAAGRWPAPASAPARPGGLVGVAHPDGAAPRATAPSRCAAPGPGAAGSRRSAAGRRRARPRSRPPRRAGRPGVASGSVTPASSGPGGSYGTNASGWPSTTAP